MRPATANNLPQGVLIDADDIPKVNQFRKWFISKRGDVYANTHPYGNGKAKSHKLHRVIMNVDGKRGIEVDHINHNRLDNRRSNLRLCTHAENGRNLPLKKNNKSGFTGVLWDKNRNKWAASIKIMFKNKHLGRFEHIEEAISARLFAENYYYGEFAPNA